MSLSDFAIRALRAVDKPIKKSDGAGLFLLVQPNGGKLWRLAYRFDGKQKSLSGGVYPTVSLAAAREWRDECKRLLQSGDDPSATRKAVKRNAKRDLIDTFEILGNAWFDNRKTTWSERHAGVIDRALNRDIYPIIGQMRIGDIGGMTLRNALALVEDRGAVETANRLRHYCGEIFRYAIGMGIIQRDPSHDIKSLMKRPAKVKHRARFKATDLAIYFDRLSRSDLTDLTRQALQWTMLTMVRTNETRFMRWDEVEGLAGSEPLWRIPADRMKMQNEHLVPLSKQATALLGEIRASHDGQGYVFADGCKQGVISENRMLYALYRLGYHGRATVHGFRGTASTILNEHHWKSDWIERQLAHVEENEVRAAYNAAEWIVGRREMLQWWADFLDRQRDTAELIG